MHGMIVYGEGFSFIVTEPEGWDANTGQAAQQMGVNIVFFPRKRESRKRHINIRVRLNKQEFTNPQQDMDADIAEYRKRYPRTRFEDLPLKHPKYRTAAKLFFTPREFYEYVAYANTGEHMSLAFSVALSKELEPATPDELAAYKKVLESLVLIQGGAH